MSVAKLESLLRKLEMSNQSDKSQKQGGFFGLARKPKMEGAGLTGGRKKKTKCAQCEYVGCKCAGGILLGGQIQGFDGGAIQGFDGGRACGAARKGKKKGGMIEGFNGSGLTGGMIAGFDGSGLTGGMKCGGKKGTMPPQLKGWLAHVAQVKAQHPNKPYKDVLKAAKQSYKK